MSPTRNIRLVALRELRLRLRSKAFLFSTGIIVVALIVSFFGLRFAEQAFGDADPAYDIGVVDDQAGEVATALDEVGGRFNIEINTTTFGSAAEGELALRDRSIDALLMDREELLFLKSASDDVALVAAEAVRILRLPAQVEALGIDLEDIQPILQPQPLPVITLDDSDDVDPAALIVAVVSMIALFVSIITYGQWVVNGVIEEKSNRVVEVLLSTIRPYQLLAGKVLGILSLALIQLVLFLLVGLVLSLATPGAALPVVAAWGLAAAVTWFVLGLAFYGLAYGVAGALVSRQEEANNVTMPLMVLLGAGYFITNISVLNAPGSTLAVVTSIVPFTAPIAMPVRVAVGEAAIWEFALSVALMLATIVVTVFIGGRIYAGAILKIGPRIALREAWRIGR